MGACGEFRSRKVPPALAPKIVSSVESRYKKTYIIGQIMVRYNISANRNTRNNDTASQTGWVLSKISPHFALAESVKIDLEMHPEFALFWMVDFNLGWHIHSGSHYTTYVYA